MADSDFSLDQLGCEIVFLFSQRLFGKAGVFIEGDFAFLEISSAEALQVQEGTLKEIGRASCRERV